MPTCLVLNSRAEYHTPTVYGFRIVLGSTPGGVACTFYSVFYCCFYKEGFLTVCYYEGLLIAFYFYDYIYYYDSTYLYPSRTTV